MIDGRITSTQVQKLLWFHLKIERGNGLLYLHLQEEFTSRSRKLLTGESSSPKRIGEVASNIIKKKQRTAFIGMSSIDIICSPAIFLPRRLPRLCSRERTSRKGKVLFNNFIFTLTRNQRRRNYQQENERVTHLFDSSLGSRETEKRRSTHFNLLQLVNLKSGKFQ